MVNAHILSHPDKRMEVWSSLWRIEIAQERIYIYSSFPTKQL